MFQVLAISVQSSSTIQIAFSQEPIDEIGVGNFEIYSDSEQNPDKRYLKVNAVVKTGKVLTLHHSYASPLLMYKIICKNSTYDFMSVMGDYLATDGIENVLSFIGQELENDIRDSMKGQLPHVYDPYEDNDLSKYISNISKELFDARTAIRQSSNSIFIECIESDTAMIRGITGSDRLPQESAYQIDRVSRYITGLKNQKSTFVFDKTYSNSVLSSFPLSFYQLRQNIVNEVISNSNTNNSFEGLVLNTANNNITQVLSIEAILDNVSYVIDVEVYKSAILNNRYDPNCYKNTTLGSNQIQLSSNLIGSGFMPAPKSGDYFVISYGYENKSLSASNVEIFIEKNVVREIAPHLINVFKLVNTNIKNISFKYPSSLSGEAAYSANHPAFLTEIEFDKSRPPSRSGEFSVNYDTGEIMVYGFRDGSGTGAVPPAISYSYTKYFQEGIDWNQDPETFEILAVPNRGLAGSNAALSFMSESVYVPDVDYVAEVHNETVEEFVENRIIGNNKISVLNGPITDVFEIVNQTTGEVYSAANFSYNEIQLSGVNLPKRAQVFGEFATFDVKYDEEIFISSQEATVSGSGIFLINLENSSILSKAGSYIGNFLNSSVILNSDILTTEVFWSDTQTQTLNFSRLSSVGKYQIDYLNGRIYARLPLSSIGSVGFASYRFGRVVTSNPQITAVDSVYMSANNSDEKLKEYELSSYSSESISLSEIHSSLETCFDLNQSNPLQLGSVLAGSLGYWENGSDIFNASDAVFTEDLADGLHTIVIDGDITRLIVQYISPTSVRCDLAFSDTDVNVSWTVLGNSNDRVYVTYSPKFIKGVYLSADILGGAGSPTNYFSGVFDSNQIFLNANPGILGDGIFVDYDFGSLYIDYEYLVDVLSVSYEWGDNQIRWLTNKNIGDTFFVTYRYGALRRELKSNFASLMNIDDLINSDMQMPREALRDLTKAAMRVFAGGPTYSNMLELSEIPTLINPSIQELSFNEWTLDRDNLFPAKPKLIGEELYTNGKYSKALSLTDSCLEVSSADSIVSYREGTVFGRVNTNWDGIDSKGSVVLNFSNVEIYAGRNNTPITSGQNISYDDSLIGRPSFFWSKDAVYFWYDDIKKAYQISYVAPRGNTITGTITTSDSFYYLGDGYIDGYGLESTDSKLLTDKTIDITFVVDVNDTLKVADGYDSFPSTPIYSDTVSFRCGKQKFFFDTGSEYNSRISLYKEPAGWLVFRVLDKSGKTWSISSDIRDWISGSGHDISFSWKLNSSDQKDEMHLFVDNQEVSNNYRLGGLDFSGTSYRSTAIEVVDASSAVDIFRIEQLSSTAGSNVLASDNDLSVFSLNIGDQVFITENTVDGIASPYLITSFNSNSITLDSALTLTLDDVSISVNATTFAIDTNIDARFVVMSDNIELSGIRAEKPDYIVTKNGGVNQLQILNGISAGSTITVETLGLSIGRARFSTIAHNGL